MSDRVVYVYCVPDDRDRIRLLVEILVRSGYAPRLVIDPDDAGGGPSVSVCTAQALAVPWFRDGLSERQGPGVAAVLDDVRLPHHELAIMNFSGWPGRSSDTALDELLAWLDHSARGGSTPAADRPPDPREPRDPGGPGARTGAGVNRDRVVAVVAVAMLASLFWFQFGPAEDAPDEGESAAQPAAAAEASTPGEEVSFVADALRGGDFAGAERAARRAGAPAATRAALAVLAGGTIDPEPGLASGDLCWVTAGPSPAAAARMAERLSGDQRVLCDYALGRSVERRDVTDSILRMCLAQDPPAQLAWSLSLDPAQRARATDALCAVEVAWRAENRAVRRVLGFALR